jgi:hypothetical protein
MYKILAGIPRPELPLTRPHSRLRRKHFSGPSSAANGAAWLKESSNDVEVVRASIRPLFSCFLDRTHIDNTWSTFARVHLVGEAGSSRLSLIWWSDVSPKEIFE